MLESKKRANAKYNSTAMKTVATCVRRETAEAFAAICRANGSTAHAVLKEYIEKTIEENK